MKKDCLTTFSKVDFNTFEPEEEIDLSQAIKEFEAIAQTEVSFDKSIAELLKALK